VKAKATGKPQSREEDTTMNITFGHVGLVVSDLDRSIRFYCDVMGMKALERYPDTGRGVEIAFVGSDCSALELLCYTDPERRNRADQGRLDHFAWYVDDIAAAMEHLAKKGVVFRPGDPLKVLDGRMIAYTTGPDGERVELVQRVK
jgi:lactoylglutathione lyase